MSAFVYVQSEHHEFGGLWTVGHYTPGGEFVPESDHDSANAAAERVAWLNGGVSRETIVELVDAALESHEDAEAERREIDEDIRDRMSRAKGGAA